jgi:nucleoside-diphosphate-sugar epimerase
VIFIQGDILDDTILKRVFKEKPDYVFHLAAHFANQNSVDNPEKDLMINGMGILKVLQRFLVLHVANVLAHEGMGIPGEAECVLQFRSAGQDLFRRERKRHGVWVILDKEDV